MEYILNNTVCAFIGEKYMSFPVFLQLMTYCNDHIEGTGKEPYQSKQRERKSSISFLSVFSELGYADLFG